MKLHELNKKHQFEWFVGFVEGHGSWQAELTGRPIFVINLQDPQILYKIKKLVGYGQVTGPYQNKSGSTYYRYRVGNLKGAKQLIEICNGRFVLNKTKKRFENYLKVYNALNSTDEIPLSNNKYVPTLDDPWLSGFIDAEGSFSGFVQKNPENDEPLAVRIRFTLVQKDEQETMNYLSNLLIN